jgi:putative ABC transport system ATP-binding protein
VSRTEVVASCDEVVRIYPAASGPVTALQHVDVRIARGEITVFVGPSGSGKSTLLRLLAAADRPDAGQVIIDGTATRDLSNRQLRRLRRRIAYVQQRPSDNLLVHLSVQHHLQHAARIAGRSRAPVGALLQELGLEAHRRRGTTTLSGGEQQRLAVAQAAIREPALLIADEPTAELDHVSATTLLEVLDRLRDRGMAVVLSTHDPTVMAIADHTYELRHGSVHTTSRAAGTYAVIDRAGRIQLPPEALERFPDRQATIRVTEDGAVRLDPP